MSIIRVYDKDRPVLVSPPAIIPKGISHSFDIGVAEKCGVEAAIVYNHIAYWIKHNHIKEINQIEGRTWTYDSHEAMAKYMPYFTARQIKGAIEKLVECGLLVKSSFNKNPFDKTNWYAIFDENILFNSKNVTDETNPSHRSPKEQNKKKFTIGRNCPIEKTNPSHLYKGTDVDKQIEEQQHAPLAKAPPSVVVFSSPIEERLRKLGTTDADRKNWAKCKYSQDDIEQALAVTDEQPRDNPLRFFRGALKEKWKPTSKILSLNEVLRNYFQHGEEYNKATCWMDADGIGFTRGIKHLGVKFNEFGFATKIKHILKEFGIKMPIQP